MNEANACKCYLTQFGTRMYRFITVCTSLPLGHCTICFHLGPVHAGKARSHCGILEVETICLKRFPNFPTLLWRISQKGTVDPSNTTRNFQGASFLYRHWSLVIGIIFETIGAPFPVHFPPRDLPEELDPPAASGDPRDLGSWSDRKGYNI